MDLKQAQSNLLSFQEIYKKYASIPEQEHTASMKSAKKKADMMITQLKMFIGLRDPWFFLKEFVYTQDEQDKKCPFKQFVTPDAPQESYRYLQELVQLWATESRLIIPKSRQLRISWLFVALCVWDCLANHGRLNMIQTKREDDAEKLIQRADVIIQHLPSEMVGKYEKTFCKITFSNTRSILWGLPQGTDVIRSNTPSHLFLDEGCFQDDLQSVYESARPCAKKITIVSSAYGNETPTPSSGFFYDLAYDNYGKDFAPADAPMGALTDYKSLEVNRNKNGFIRAVVDQKRIQYRYFEGQLMTREDWLRKEQPGYTKESWAIEQDINFFAKSTNHVFEPELITRIESKLRDPIKRGKLQQNPQTKEIYFVEDPNGPLSIWELPQQEKLGKMGRLLQPAGQYVAGVDTGGGISYEGDLSTATIIDKKSKAVVAIWGGHLYPQYFARELYLLVKFYNEAYTVVESNTYGLVVLTSLWDGLERYGQPSYTNLYFDKTLGDNYQKDTPKMGCYITNTPGSRKKILLIDQFAQATRDGELQIYSKTILDEMRRYIRFLDGRMGASKGNDDFIISTALAWEGVLNRPYYENSDTPKTSKSNPWASFDDTELLEHAGSSITGY